MEQQNVVKFCKSLGCCDACCIRYLGLKNPSSYNNVHQLVLKHLDSEVVSIQDSKKENLITNSTSRDDSSTQTDVVFVADTGGTGAGSESPGEHGDPPAKRVKLQQVCVCCLGVLQEETWPETQDMVRHVLNKKSYSCESVACALSAPTAVLLRERAVTLLLEAACPSYRRDTLTPLKEAWKWTFGRRLASGIGKRLEPGDVAPLLLTVTFEYPDEPRELELVRALAPEHFAERGQQRRRYAVEFTRRAVEQALESATAATIGAAGWERPPLCAAPARPVSVVAVRTPLYLAGRYVKLSRTLPQTPWVVGGRRMMHSSVQETIVEPLGALYGLNAEETARQLKLVAAGREDVDVRCLGTGRPFAIEISDARREPSAAELEAACARMSAGGAVLVRRLVPVPRAAMALLKQGERSKTKTYEALCVKLSGPVTADELAHLSAYRNTPDDCEARVQLVQRTPLRVLHRRPLLARARRLYALEARAVPAAPALFVVRVRAEAGTYIKEWAHGELRRTVPSLCQALGAPVDIVALDVADVDLPWPPNQ